MAVYPGSVRTFSTKQDKININYAADINAVQDEITATQKALGINVQGASVDATTRLSVLEADFGKFKWGNVSVTTNAYGVAAVTHNLGVIPSTVILTHDVSAVALPSLGGSLLGLGVEHGLSSTSVFFLRVYTALNSNNVPFVGGLTINWFVGA